MTASDIASPLWAKGGITFDSAVQRFCAADDVMCDRALFRFDIHATRAHVAGLARIGLLTDAERTTLHTLLTELDDAFAAGAFVLDERFEDGHTAIEHFLTERAGEVGRKVHTARSRNDQVLVAQRLWLKVQLHDLANVCTDIVDVCLQRAKAGATVVMPGFTHLQRAMPTTLGAWFAGLAELFIDDGEAALAARSLADKSPLGTGAGFGVSLPLDRLGVAADLGFDGVVVSPLAAQTGRGKLELFGLQALHLAAVDVRRLAWDLSLFATTEFGFARLPDAYTTGSSLMPNKRNPDVVELLRTVPGVVEGAMTELSSVLAIPTSYHRDLQATKGPVVRAFSRALAGLHLIPPLLAAVAFDEDRMRAAISGDMYATDRALELAVAGVPFRDAYKQAAAEIPTLASRSPDESVRARISLGGAGNLGLDLFEIRLNALRQRLRG